MHGILGIDHPVIAIADMQRGRETFERLGFTVPPRGRHLEWGTGNWCIMFPQDYLELRGVVDASRYLHGLDEFLRRREGLMGVAFATADARTSCDLLRASGIQASPVRELTRAFELPGGDVYPRFVLCFPDAAATPGLMSVVLCQHLTPDLLRRPEFLAHPNTATRVAAMTAVVESCGAVTPVYRKFFGPDAVIATADTTRIRTGAGVIDVITPASLPPLYDRVPEPPFLAGAAVAVSSLDKARTALSQGDVPFQEDGAVVRVAPRYAAGMILEFIQE